MSKTEVQVDIRSVIHYDHHQEQNHHHAQGKLFQKDSHLYLRYVENMAEVGRIQNTIKIEENQVTVIRHGGVKMNQVYRLGETTIGTYHTPAGPLDMETTTTQLVFSPLQEGKGGLRFAYQLKLNREPIGQCQMDIDLKAE